MRYKENYDIDLVRNGFDAKEDINTFMASQIKRFTCPVCNGVIDQHHRRCSECRKPVENKNDNLDLGEKH